MGTPLRSFVFGHLADAHVGAWPRDAAVRRALRESVLRAFRVVEERGCQFLLISGDLFHTPVPEPAEVAPVAAGLRRLVDRGIGAYVIYGSHDYVAHRTSWLDVLAETGIFLRAAPEAVREEGTRWSLPFRVDPRTGAVIAGLSGRAHGLDRAYFAGLDTEAFRAAEGFKVFQFHAAIDEYLPSGLRQHLHGISRHDLPGGVDYYAGGHIHYTYEGEGPEGGLLVNPGAVFGTSLPDLENGAKGRTHQGVAIVTVEDLVPQVEFVDTAPKERIRVFDVDVDGRTPEEARVELDRALAAHAGSGALIFPRVHGRLKSGTLGELGLARTLGGDAPDGSEHVHWDVRDASAGLPEPEEADASEAEARWAGGLVEDVGTQRVGLAGEAGERTARELLRELGTGRSEGESKADYEAARVRAGLLILGLARTEPLGE